jgi:hypothetical protein
MQVSLLLLKISFSGLEAGISEPCIPNSRLPHPMAAKSISFIIIRHILTASGETGFRFAQLTCSQDTDPLPQIAPCYVAPR